MDIVHHRAQAIMTSDQTRYSHATATQSLKALRVRVNEASGAILYSMPCAPCPMLQGAGKRRVQPARALSCPTLQLIAGGSIWHRCRMPNRCPCKA